MTRRETISAAALQARAFELASRRVNWLLGEQKDDATDLLTELKTLVPFGAIALVDLIQRFGLSPLERDVLLLCAAPELGLDAARAIAAHPLAVHGRATPALTAFVLGPEANAALAATGTLRHGALVELNNGQGFAQRTLTLADPVTAFLHGQPEPDPVLSQALLPLPPARGNGTVLVQAMIAARKLTPPPLIHLTTEDASRAHAVATAACAELGLVPLLVQPDGLPDTLPLDSVARMLNRDLVLMNACAILPDTPEGCRIAEAVFAPLVLTGSTLPETLRPLANLVLTPADDPEPEPDQADIHRHFALGPRDLRNVAATDALRLAPNQWHIARKRAARDLEGLAERITPQATWDDLVLHPSQMAQLRQLAAFKTHSEQVLGEWGFREKSSRGLALTALFGGPSGTGKTMAAEILARALGPKDDDALDLFRIDLSAVVSKYIGETEKNIGRIFDAAENAGAVLLFDEGEALFAKRASDVKDSVDRHANSETAYLLQRLENYTGVAIVTTNMKASVDEAFLRRFRAVIEFSFPTAELRAEIWRKVFPPQTPLAELDYSALSRLAMSGGFIRATALTAAFLAAAEGSAVTMAHLERAARQEYGKQGKRLSEPELRGFR